MASLDAGRGGGTVQRLKFAILGVLGLLVVTAAPVSAITYGQPDAGEHPYVGFMIFFDPSSPGWFSCSGTLLDSNTFLTAGHCTFPVGRNGHLAGSSARNDVWVTFKANDALAGFPQRADLPPNEAAVYAARSAFLNSNPNYVRGIAHPNPAFNDFASFSATNDVGVVEFSSSVLSRTGGRTGRLAPLGTAQVLAQRASTRNLALIETVGYGIQSVQPHPQEIESRFKSTSRIVNLSGSISRGGNLHTLNNPSPVGGVGGSCFGDSGGPLFVNNTNQVVAVVSFGFSKTCHGADYSWRVDTRPSQNFINQFLS